jgi:hypothetical protein
MLLNDGKDARDFRFQELTRKACRLKDADARTPSYSVGLLRPDEGKSQVPAHGAKWPLQLDLLVRSGVRG